MFHYRTQHSPLCSLITLFAVGCGMQYDKSVCFGIVMQIVLDSIQHPACRGCPKNAKMSSSEHRQLTGFMVSLWRRYSELSGLLANVPPVLSG